MELNDDLDEFIDQPTKSIKCMFIGVGDLQKQAEKT